MPDEPLGAVDGTLLRRVQNFISNDINSKIRLEGPDIQYRVRPLDIYIISFERILNVWTISATAEAEAHSFYKIVYNADTGRAIVRIYIQHGSAFEGIL